jgi:hypothetical protein
MHVYRYHLGMTLTGISDGLLGCKEQRSKMHADDVG